MSQGGFSFLETSPFGIDDVWSTLPLVSLDTETTSADPKAARLLEVAAIRFSKGQALDRWSSLCDPGCEIPAEASAIHGITWQTVEGAPAPIDLAPELVARCSGAIAVGYNLISFDLPILERELAIAKFGRPTIDALVFVRWLDRFARGKGRHKLSVTAERHGIAKVPNHRALADAETVIHLLARLRPKLPERLGELLQLQDKLMREQAEDWARYQASLKRDGRTDSAGPRESQSPAKDEVGSFGGVA